MIDRDLLAAGTDVLRMAAPHAATDGTMAIRDGVLHQEAENLLLALACAVVQPGHPTTLGR